MSTRPYDYDWRWKARIWDFFDFTEPQQRAAAALAGFLEAHAPARASLLDMGCGTGARTLDLLAPWQHMAWRCHWLDPSGHALAALADRAAERLPGAAHTYLQSTYQDYLVRAEARAFDVFLSTHSFFFPKPQVADLVARTLGLLGSPGLALFEISASNSALHVLQNAINQRLWHMPNENARSYEIEQAVRDLGAVRDVRDVRCHDSFERIWLPASLASEAYRDLDDAARSFVLWFVKGRPCDDDTGQRILDEIRPMLSVSGDRASIETAVRTIAVIV